MQFERIPHVKGGKNLIQFDSSPDRAIARNFGYKEGTVELREIARTEAQVDYEVWARENYTDGQEPKALRKRGVLKHIPREEMLRRLSGGVFHGRPFH